MSDNVTREDLKQYVDWTSLQYYDAKIKSYIDSKEGSATDVKDIENKIKELEHLVTDNTTAVKRIDTDLDNITDRTSNIEQDVLAKDHSIHDILHLHEKTFATKIELSDAVKELEEKIGSGSQPSEDYATKQYVQDEISKLSLNDVKIRLETVENNYQDISNNYNDLITEVSNISNDLNNYITKEEGVTKTEVEEVVNDKIAEVITEGVSVSSIDYGEF